METIFNLIAGALVLFGAIKRYQNIDSLEFVGTVQLTMFIFVSFCLGFLIIDASKAMYLTNSLMYESRISFFVWLSPCLLPIAFLMAKGYSFRSSWRWNNYILYLPIAFVVLFAILRGIYFENQSDNYVYGWLAYFPYLLSAFILLAFTHSIFGPVIAAINIVLVVNHFIEFGFFSVSLSSVFDLLSTLGFSSEPLKWVILLGSTILGLHGTVDTFWLKQKIS